MITLVLNAGSSSLKFAAFNGRRKALVGIIDRLGPDAEIVLGQRRERVPARTVAQALRVLRDVLRGRQLMPDVVAHRVVHGGGVYWRPTRVTPAVVRRLKGLTDLAPLHMPNNLQTIAAAQLAWPKAQHWGVFDTAAFHHLPATTQTYALPSAVRRRWRIRKYGFHGISHQWAFRQAARRLHRPPLQCDAVTIHLGAGDSMTLWQRGRPTDTSMGFTPLEGLTMMTRSGDLDPAIPLFLVRHGLSVDRVRHMLEERSGLFGLTGLRDMRDVLAAAGHPIPGWPRQQWTAHQRRQARLGLDIFLYDIQRYLASYLGQVNRRALIVFTGAMSKNTWLRRQILRWPATRGHRVVVIPTDEEMAIATDVWRMVD